MCIKPDETAPLPKESTLRIRRVGDYYFDTTKRDEHCKLCGNEDFADVLIDGICGRCLTNSHAALVEALEKMIKAYEFFCAQSGRYFPNAFDDYNEAVAALAAAKGEKKISDAIRFCGLCKYLVPNEYKQSAEKEDHICRKYHEALKHLGHHPEIPRLAECDEPMNR